MKNCEKLLIEVNQLCNLNCTYCFYRDYGRVKEQLSINNIEEILQKCPNTKEFYLTGGECFASKNIDEIIEKLSIKGTVIVFTNGVILNSYNDKRFNKVVDDVSRFIISFDSFDFDNYICRKNLNKTLEVIKKIIKKDPNKVEVKVCINKFNYPEFEDTLIKLIDLGVKYLSVNFVFDIKNSEYKHEIIDKKELKNIFNIINKYHKYFNKRYIDTLYELYINNKINNDYPCLADDKYYYLDCTNKLLICPGNCKKLGFKGDWEKCYSKECANEWEIMYMR